MNHPPALPVPELTDLQRILFRLDAGCSFLRVALARLTGVRLGDGASIGRGAEVALLGTPARRGRIEIGAHSEICTGSLFHPRGGSIVLADWVHVGPGCVLYGLGGISIGEQTLLAPGVRIISASHTVPDPEVLIRSQPDIPQPVQIGRDVWIGAGATILGGVTLGAGCIIGAGSVVTKEIPPHAIAYGVPARVQGSRVKDTPKSARGSK